MKNINLREAKLKLLEEVTEGKYQLIFHDYRYETRYRYYNPEDKESYLGCHVEKI